MMVKFFYSFLCLEVSPFGSFLQYIALFSFSRLFLKHLLGLHYPFFAGAPSIPSQLLYLFPLEQGKFLLPMNLLGGWLDGGGNSSSFEEEDFPPLWNQFANRNLV